MTNSKVRNSETQYTSRSRNRADLNVRSKAETLNNFHPT